MTSRLVLRARAVWLLGIGIALAGFYPVLVLLMRSVLPGTNAGPLPEGLNAALPLAMLGVAAIALGGLIARRQAHALAKQKQRREDAKRRVQYYRDSSRIEPSIRD